MKRGPEHDEVGKAATVVDPSRSSPQSNLGPDTASDLRTLAKGFETGESNPRAVDGAGARLEAFDPSARYDSRRTLGEGGMGEVRLCADAFVGREVAMKVIRSTFAQKSEARSRFLREARVQGQLEHPSVVPVYDIGISPSGEVFFTMKRIVGRTLEEIIRDLHAGDAATITEFSRRKLLTAVSQVCLTLAFAHQKGVVHRDLKPANIMLGDFGEVYVLDWGIAKIPSATEPTTMPPVSEPAGAKVGQTQDGALLGTPGYMSPEQARGEAAACDARSDVYALGAVLYETVSGVPMMRARNIGELLVESARIDGARPLEVAPDLPPELDEICARATRRAPEDRYATAREMHDALERYLDGERDLERRMKIADLHAARAVQILAEEVPIESREQKRGEAMRELGAALALQPEHPAARKAMVELLIQEPETVPEGAAQELAEINRRGRARGALGAAWSYVSWVFSIPVVIWMGVRSVGYMVGLAACIVALTAYMFWIGRTRNTEPRFMRYSMVGNFIVVSGLSALFGPLVLVPQSVLAVAASLMISSRANALTRFALAGFSIAAVFVPLVLGWAGVIPDPYTFENGTIVIHPVAVDFPPIPTLIVLMASTAFATLTSARLMGEGVEALIANERRTVARAFRLRQLLPIADEPVRPV